MKHPSFLVIAALATAAGGSLACGKIPTANGNGDGGTADATPGAFDAPVLEITNDVEGTWKYRLGDASAPAENCDVTIGIGTYDILCEPPGLPMRVGMGNCMQTKAAAHFSGGLTKAMGFDGVLESITHFEGSDCAAQSLQTGIDIVNANGQMMATHATDSPYDGFWGPMGGLWKWTGMGQNPPPLLCDVTFDMTFLMNMNGSKWRVLCAGDAPHTVATNCTEQSFLVIAGTVTGTTFDGAENGELHHMGAGCGTMFPAIQPQGMPLPMHADRQ